jgi:flagellin
LKASTGRLAKTKEKKMSIVVNTNTQSIFAQRALGRNTLNLQKSIEKLSTGSRINKAADDAAGLSISEKLTSQVRGLEKAKQNAGDGISMIQTAEGGLSVVHDNLQRIRELVVQAKNGTNSTSELDSIQREINERITTIDDIAGSTKYNSNNLIQSASAKTFQIGADDGQTLNVALDTIDIDIDDTAASTLGEGAIKLSSLHVGGSIKAQDGTTSAANGTIANVDSMITNVSKMRSYLGAVQNSLESRMDYLDVAIENNSASRSRVKDVDVAKESSNMLKNQILQQSAAQMLSQANSTPQLALNLLP